MAWADLTVAEQNQVKEFTREYRAAFAETVRGLRKQQLLAQAYNLSISDLWVQISNGEVIPDDTGLAGADKSITKSQFNSFLLWSSALIDATFDDGGVSAYNWTDEETVTGYAVQLAGPSNI